MNKTRKPVHLLQHKKAHHSKWLLIGDICGWIGAAGLLSAYFLASYGIVEGQSWLYQILNLVGAAGLLILAAARHAVPSVVTNMIWILIGAFAIVELLKV
jgi:hypothetical protein